MNAHRLIMPAVLCFSLGGCMVGAAVDLAATTVFTAGKLAVKGTGALIDAAIPDKDEREAQKAEKQRKEAEKAKTESRTVQLLESNVPEIQETDNINRLAE